MRPVVIGIDLLLSTLGIAVLAVVLDVNAWLFFFGGFLGILPDTMWLPYIINGRETPRHKNTPLHMLRRFHMKIQWSETYKGFMVEVLWLIILLALLFKLT